MQPPRPYSPDIKRLNAVQCNAVTKKSRVLMLAPRRLKKKTTKIASHLPLFTPPKQIFHTPPPPHSLALTGSPVSETTTTMTQMSSTFPPLQFSCG